MKANLFFRVLKVWCTAGLHFYFREWYINNASAVRVTGPVIFIPTHQNAFMDAILVICSTPRNPWSIARASVFKKGLVTKLLTAIQIKPVFRVRDGFSSLKNNDAIMLEWTNMLAKGQDIMIFAEGNHNDPYARGTLQRGFARMALKFQQQHQQPLHIIPVGIHYDDHPSFRSRTLVNYGDPISVNDVLHAHLNEREKLDQLVAVTEEALGKLAIAIDPDDQYKSKFDFLTKHRVVQKNMLDQLESDQRVLESYPNPPDQPQEPRLGSIWKAINPLVWAGWLFHILPYTLITAFIRKRAKDPQFIASLKYAFGLFLIPVYYLLLILTFYMIFPSATVTLLFALLLPLTGVVSTDILKK
ncbi:MAG TPA: 1-acyl-sn-glycerol-3-phosphate acyltransferase [Chryseolinea sp.]|nr:1-acyl-sn-glycerol-3-phosphate acyltransferase [Chryseolinea sp.]